MGGLKKELPITYWTFLIGALAIAGVPGLAGFFSKDEILFRTFASGHTVLWVVGMLTSLLTAIYMFRLVFLTFHGERRPLGRARQARLRHGAPGTMRTLARRARCTAPTAICTMRRRRWRSRWSSSRSAPCSPATSGCRMRSAGTTGSSTSSQPSFVAHGVAASIGSESRPRSMAARPHPASGRRMRRTRGEAPRRGRCIGRRRADADGRLELVALAGIGIAWFFFLRNRPRAADAVASAFAGRARCCSNKYYVDEIYDAAIVQPIKRLVGPGLWKGSTSGVIDGAVNGVGRPSSARASSVLRRLQTGSVRAYAASLFLGVVLILGYYLW